VLGGGFPFNEMPTNTLGLLMRRAMTGGAVLICLLTASCTELPVSGPDDKVIMNFASTGLVRPPDTPAYAYAVIDLDDCVVKNAADFDGGSLFKSFGKGKGPAPSVAVGPGDVLQVTVFESKSGGLFIPADSGTRPGNYVTLPPMMVDHKGIIAVPYGGDIKAAGKSVQQIERDIEDRLADKAIEPKAIVTLAEQNATTVAVLGEVNTPRKARLTQNGERVLDMIASAGGPRNPGYETYVSLQRRGKTATIYFNNLVSHPEENIYSMPGDTIYVFREPRRFIALGAVGVATGVGASSALTGLSSLFTFDQDKLTLAEAVGKAGGLLDYRSNPAQVFLYRFEHREALAAMGVDLSRFPPEQKRIPTVYRANFRDPSSYFFAQQFQMRDKDVLYAANANAVEVVKFIDYANAITGGISNTAVDAALTSKGIRYVTTGTAPGF
jgi:polysaccharide export outer membrane protein